MNIRAFLTTFVTLLLLNSSAYAETKSYTLYDDWVSSRHQDEMTYEVTKTAFTTTTDGELLIVECSPGYNLNVFLKTNEFINLRGKFVNVWFKFDDQPPTFQVWNITRNDVTGILNTASKKELRKFVKGLTSNSGNVKLRYEDANTSTHDVAFSLHGSTAALKDVLFYCGIFDLHKDDPDF